MGGFHRRRASVAPILLVFFVTFGCSRPTPDIPGESTSQAAQTPFQGQSISGHDPEPPSASSVHSSDSAPPFQSSEIPIGTLLTVSLKGPIVAGSGSRGSFDAIVDEPVIIDGVTVIPRGAAVSGRIQSARISNLRPDRGYVRLALESIHAENLSSQLQTASLFARQLTQTGAAEDTIRLETGRRLTFRLTEPIFLNNQRAKTER